jgi:hypothetical protein
MGSFAVDSEGAARVTKIRSFHRNNLEQNALLTIVAASDGFEIRDPKRREKCGS